MSGYFLDFFNGMKFVSGVDTFGRITGVEILVEFQTADLLDNGYTFVLGNARIYTGYIVDS